jgi:hypothetical protein
VIESLSGTAWHMQDAGFIPHYCKERKREKEGEREEKKK